MLQSFLRNKAGYAGMAQTRLRGALQPTPHTRLPGQSVSLPQDDWKASIADLQMPSPGFGHSLSGGDYEAGDSYDGPLSVPIDAHGPTGNATSTHIGGNLGGVGGQLGGSEANYGINATAGGFGLGVSQTENEFGRKTTGIEAQASKYGASAHYEDENVFGQIGMSSGVGFGLRAHHGDKIGIGGDFGKFSMDAAIKPPTIDRMREMMRENPDPSLEY